MLTAARWHHKRAMGVIARQEQIKAKAAEDSAADDKAKTPAARKKKDKEEQEQTPESLIAEINTPIDAFITKEFAAAVDHAAKVACFVHPRLSSVEKKPTFDPTVYTDDELKLIDSLFAKQHAARGTPGNPGGPREVGGGARGDGSTRH
jgi:hypothetical protein